MKKNAIFGLTILAVLVGGLLLWMSAFVVRQDQQAVVTRWGELVQEINTAGLHFKVPFSDEAHLLEKRILEFDGDPEQTQTNDKKPIRIDTFARWRIEDPTKFFRAVRDESNARAQLGRIINSETRNAIARHTLVEVVRNSNRPLTQDKEIAEARQQLATVGGGVTSLEGAPGVPIVLESDVEISTGREGIMTEIREAATAGAAEFGIRLVDFKIKRINYGTNVQSAVYERMRSDREQIAQKYRSEGQERFAAEMGRIEQEKKDIISGATKEALTIMGNADAEAARIYADAYGQDKEFYAFWKTLQIYREHLTSNSTLVLSTDSDLFRYLRNAGLSGIVRDG